MKLKRTLELYAFLSTYFADADLDADVETTQAFIQASSPALQSQVISQFRALLSDPEIPVEELGSEVNRWFGDADEAGVWLRGILGLLEGAQAAGQGGSDLTVKDSHGSPLSEGDSVQVIKDLKVKGGSSDLKRGTLIKKIHLIGDSEAIECRVDGSTLVLKTCFLKKV